MSKLAMRLMIGDKELRAIGHVAAQWAYLETQIDYVIAVLVAQPSTKELELRISQSFQKRMELLRKAAKIVLVKHQEPLSELLNIATDASSLRGFRDDIIHGHWKLHRERGVGPLTTGIEVFSRGRIKEMAFSATKAEGVAAKISSVNLRLITWCTNNIPDR
jgi:mRNA-degrading endonuclease YafQ of YafQ-DinJ toxin-antitoxin module